MRLALCALLMVIASFAHAQQPQQQTPSQLARQMVNVINNWADALEQAQRQLEALTRERDELKAKLEAKEKSDAK